MFGQRLIFVLYSLVFVTVCNLTERTPLVVEGTFFEYELPNRTVTICPTNSLLSIECPQIPLPLTHEHRLWQANHPQYLISIDYIRSFPSRLGHDPTSCQADLSHACSNYDLRYINTLCNGKALCPDIPAYQVRDRSLCAFKAVTEIGFHCVPTWHQREIQTKCDICKNGSLTNDYGFIYSRNYPLQTLHQPCFTTIYARPYHKTVLYFVNGELNHDQLRIESVSSDGMVILNVTLNGNQTTQRLAMSTYEMRITFLPNHVYAQRPTYYLLYFYTIPFCSYTDPCPPPPSPHPTTPPIIPTTTSRMRVQSVGWTRIPNLWIIVPVILAYILLLMLITILALLFRRRRKQQKVLTSMSSRYLENSGTSSRAQLVTPGPVPVPPAGIMARSSYRRASASQSVHYPLSSPSFARNMERYHRESRSDFDLHQSAMSGIDYHHRAANLNRAYGTMDYGGARSSSMDHHRRSLPKSFSDCDLCRRRVQTEEYRDYYQEDQDENWRLENSIDRREPRAYREKVKERFRERLSIRPDPNSSVEYSTVLPRHQRITSESARSTAGPVHHLPFEYIPTENSSNVRTVEYKRNANEERVAVGQQLASTDECGTSNFTVKFYQHDDEDDEQVELDRCLHEAREVQEMSMRMIEQQHFNRHPSYAARHYNGNAEI